MRLRSAITFLTLFGAAFAAHAAPLPSPHQVDIPLANGTLHAQLFKPAGDGPFPVVIALHGCGGLAARSRCSRFRALVLIGATDDAAPPPPCHQIGDGARGRSALPRIVIYPGAYHDFDRANVPAHASAGTPDAALPEGGHLGTDPEARADSQKLVAEWLAR